LKTLWMSLAIYLQKLRQTTAILTPIISQKEKNKGLTA